MAEAPELKRSLSLWLLTLYGLGVTVGGGIYALIGKVAGHAGLFAPVSFLVAAVLAAFSAFSYTELVARFPKSAAEAVYVEEGLRRPWLAVLTGIGLVGVALVSAATLAIGFVGYFRALVPVPDWLAIGAVVLALSMLAAWGIRESALAAAAVTVIEVGGLLAVIAAGGGLLADSRHALAELVPGWDATTWAGILAGSFLAFYAFIGFEDMDNVAEEVEDVTRVMPRAILLTLAVTTALYMAVAIVAVLAVPPEELAASGAPLALVFERGSGWPATAINLVGVLAVVNGILVQIILASRVLYGMSRRGWLTASLGRVHARTQTPLIATFAVAAAILVLALGFAIEELARTTTLITLVIFALCNASLLALKRRGPPPAGIRPVPAWVPTVGLVVSVAFAVLELGQRFGLIG